MVDVTDATFETEVLQRSETTAVVVDLWAPWCGPCRTLGPILEQVIGETGGEVVLAKVNTDENPAVSDMFQVQGIPAVYAIKDRKVVANFMGAQPEAAVRQFVDALRPSEADRKVAALVAAGDEASLLEALALEPANADAIVALAELYVGSGRNSQALALLAKIPESAETRRVAALARTGAEGDPAAPDGPLADVETKLDELLTRVKTDDDARQEVVDLLELMGPDDPRTARYRQALSRQLF
jgi:putative thioredoxin